MVVHSFVVVVSKALVPRVFEGRIVVCCFHRYSLLAHHDVFLSFFCWGRVSLYVVVQIYACVFEGCTLLRESTPEFVDEASKCAYLFQMMAFKQYILVVLFILLYKVDITFVS